MFSIDKLSDSVYAKLISVLTPELWKEVLDLDDNDAQLACLNLIVNAIQDLLFPLKSRRVKFNTPSWNLDPEAKKARDKAHKIAIRENTSETWSIYKRYRNRATSILRLCKARYLVDLGKDMKGNPNKFWRHFSHISKSKTSSNHVNSKYTAEDFNQFFLSIASDLSHRLPPSGLDPASYISFEKDEVPQFSFRSVEEEEMCHLINCLDCKKSSGVDNISASFIKLCCPILVEPITGIFNRSFIDCKMPSLWKNANIFPIQKSKDNDSISNYRPISVLRILSKLFERVISDQLTDHMTRHDLLSTYQAGFRKGFSTQDVLVHITDIWKKAN